MLEISHLDRFAGKIAVVFGFLAFSICWLLLSVQHPSAQGRKSLLDAKAAYGRFPPPATNPGRQNSAVAPLREERPEWQFLSPDQLRLRSICAVIADQRSGETVYAKDADTVVPIASITKLMTAMVLLDARMPMETRITITPEDRDLLKGSHSRLPVGWTVSRRDLLQVALMSSENRAAAALARTYPGGTRQMIADMNAKGRQMALRNTHFEDPTGLSCDNTSTAADLVKIVNAAYGYREIRRMTTTDQYLLRSYQPVRIRCFGNSNGLIRNHNWQIGLSKTGYIAESNYCLAMQAVIKDRPLVMVFLGAAGKYSRLGDANRVKNWLAGNVRRSNPPHPAHRTRSQTAALYSR